MLCEDDGDDNISSSNSGSHSHSSSSSSNDSDSSAGTTDGLIFMVNAPKDWRRETVKEYLRETHDLFREERNARGYDDDSDVDMEYYYAIDEKHEEYFNRFKNNN